jgi:hypothetical protein
MSELAYQDFLALPVNALFTSSAEWGESDAFIKVDADRYRRTYDYITWNADGGGMVPGTLLGTAGGIRGGKSWPGIRVMDEVPQWISHNPPLTEEQCREHERADYKRVREYIEKTGELPEMGFW